MAIGSFMGRVFTVSHTKIFTPSNLKGSTGERLGNTRSRGRQGPQ